MKYYFTLFLSAAILSFGFSQSVNISTKALLQSYNDFNNSLQVSGLKIQEFKKEIHDIESKAESTLDSIQRKENNLRRIESLEKIVATILTKQAKVEKYQKKIDSLAADNSLEEVKFFKERYLQAMSLINFIKGKEKAMIAIYTWGSFIDQANTLSNPNSFDDFSTSLEFLKSKQKKGGLKFPDLDLQNPVLNTGYAFINGLLSSKGDQAERRASIDKLNCILEFTIKIEGRLKFIGLEGEYLKSLASANNSNTLNIEQEMFELVGERVTEDPRQYTLATHKFKDESFIRTSRSELERQISRVTEQYQKYQFMVQSSLATLDKVNLAIEEIQTTCPASPSVEAKITSDLKLLTAKIKESKQSIKSALPESDGHYILLSHGISKAPN